MSLQSVYQNWGHWHDVCFLGFKFSGVGDVCVGRRGKELHE